MAEVTLELPFPERIGDYELLLPLGTGGMASVYLARIRVVGDVHRDVAIKLVHAEANASAEAALEMLEEAKLAARVRHPNVVQVTEVGESLYGVYIIMDYVEGEPLAGLISAAGRAGRTIPDAMVAKILSDALTGLHAAHELRDEMGTLLQLVHRDFSPQNVLAGTDGVARLADFGIAKALTRLGVTRTGIVKGKVGYMAPEQARGEVLDRRADVWAAGVVIWEAFAGRRLFRKHDEVVTLAEIVAPTPAPGLCSARPDLPPAVERVVARALSKDREGRPSTVAELRGELLEALRPVCRPAESDELGAYVTEVAGQKLAERRASAAEVIRLRQRVAKLASRSLHPEEPSAPATQSHEPKRMRRLALGGAGAALIAAALLAAGSRPTEVRPAPLEPAVTAAAAPAEAHAPRQLEILSEVPISALRIDERAVELTAPATRFRVELTPEESDRSLRILGIAADGRRSRIAQVSAAGTAAELAFPAPSAGKPTGRFAPAKPPRTGARLIPLAPAPYD